MGSLGPPASRSLDIAIVGGGIAGLTLALGLMKRGLQPTIYERGASFREIGAGIGFTQNAEWAMKLLDPQVHAAFKRVTVPNGTDWFVWVDGMSEKEEMRDGECVGEEVDGVKVIHRMYLGERGFEGCARADFLDELVKLMPSETVRFAKNLVQVVDEPGKDKVEMQFADGSTAEADVVIACDGIRSALRRHVLRPSHSNPTQHDASYTHKYAFRGLIPMPQALAALGPTLCSTRHMYLGANAHCLTFPIANSTLLNVVAFTTDSDPWPHADRFTAPASKQQAVEAFAGFNETVRKIIGLLPEEGLNKWAVFDTYDAPADTFVRGRVVLAGDAAHAAAPYHGAGAGFAVEDALVLAEACTLVQAELENRDRGSKGQASRLALVANALATYDEVRLRRARWLVETSRYIGHMYQWQDAVVGADRGRAAAEIEWRCRRIWEYDVEDMVAETRGRFARGLKMG